MSFVEACLTAYCRDCGGIKAIECEPQEDNKLVKSWIARGDIVGAETISWLRSEGRRCSCGSKSGDGS